MHLSGLFSMVAGSLKAWTAALRTGRAFLTPLARGLVDPAQCGERGSNQPGLRCWFEALVPACEEGAQRGRAPPPQLVFNLPQLHRESLATAAAVPAPFAALGAFWWTAQYTARLMRPAPRLRALLETALQESGLAAALAAGPVAGFHVRHGGCNPMHPRLQLCARGCNHVPEAAAYIVRCIVAGYHPSRCATATRASLRRLRAPPVAASLSVATWTRWRPTWSSMGCAPSSSPPTRRRRRTYIYIYYVPEPLHI